jgi:hypothetical protein
VNNRFILLLFLPRYIWIWLKYILVEGRCDRCWIRRAVWWYGPGPGGQRCDKCVPRGCSCNREPIDGNPDNENSDNWREIVDDLGRKYPCCEWMPLNPPKGLKDEYDLWMIISMEKKGEN